MIQLVTVSTAPARHFHSLLETAQRFGFDAVVLGESIRWPGHGLKLRLLHEHVRRQTDPGLRILFTDAHDVLLVRPAREVEAVYEQVGAPILVAGEKYCYPDPWKVDYYPESPTPWRFLNSGGILGEVEPMLAVFEEYAHLYDDVYDDQRWWTDRYLTDAIVTRRGRIQVDVGCQVFQCVYDGYDALELGAIVRNRVTGSCPAVMHGPGHADLAPLLEWLERHGPNEAGK